MLSCAQVFGVQVSHVRTVNVAGKNPLEPVGVVAGVVHLVFCLLFAFALNNEQPAVVNGFFGTQWQAPMVIVVLAVSACAPATRHPRPSAHGPLGEPPLADRQTEGFSTGEKLKVAIARALVNNPSILLADEPTGNLDSRTSVEVMAVFQTLNAQGITVLLVTHEPDIACYAKRIIELRDGRVVRDEPPDAEPAAHVVERPFHGQRRRRDESQELVAVDVVAERLGVAGEHAKAGVEVHEARLLAQLILHRAAHRLVACAAAERCLEPAWLAGARDGGGAQREPGRRARGARVARLGARGPGDPRGAGGRGAGLVDGLEPRHERIVDRSARRCPHLPHGMVAIGEAAGS